VAALIAFSPNAATASMEQVVKADDGIMATGTVTRALYPDGTEREVSVMLVAPRGVTTATGSGEVDLSRAWALVKETVVADPSGKVNPGTTVCSSLSNPERWAGGGLTQHGDKWTGSTFEFRCDGATPYDAYRVRWEPANSWVLVTNPVTAAWMSSHLIRWSSSTAQGSIAARPTANQQSTMTLCGVQQGRPECFTGAGAVVPSLDGMVITAIGA
jgi:hypothetical protein